MGNGQRQYLDVWGRATSIEPLDTGWTISGTVITYAYDPLGQVQQAVRGTNGATTSYAYDLAGHITRTVDADLGTWLYTYRCKGTSRVEGTNIYFLEEGFRKARQND